MNECSGLGTYIWASGQKFVGSYEAGKQHGLGRLTTTAGVVIEQMWREGVLVEESTALSVGGGPERTSGGTPPLNLSIDNKNVM
jgi:hypothetical protein